MKCGFDIGYGILRKYQPIWVSVLVLDRNQNSGFGRTLESYIWAGFGHWGSLKFIIFFLYLFCVAFSLVSEKKTMMML